MELIFISSCVIGQSNIPYRDRRTGLRWCQRDSVTFTKRTGVRQRLSLSFFGNPINGKRRCDATWRGLRTNYSMNSEKRAAFHGSMNLMVSSFTKSRRFESWGKKMSKITDQV